MVRTDTDNVTATATTTTFAPPLRPRSQRFCSASYLDPVPLPHSPLPLHPLLVMPLCDLARKHLRVLRFARNTYSDMRSNTNARLHAVLSLLRRETLRERVRKHAVQYKLENEKGDPAVSYFVTLRCGAKIYPPPPPPTHTHRTHTRRQTHPRADSVVRLSVNADLPHFTETCLDTMRESASATRICSWKWRRTARNGG